MAARVTPSERFRFGIEYVPTISFDSTTSSYSGTAVQISIFDDGQTGDTQDDTVDIQTVTASGYSDTTRSFSFTHTIETAAQFFLIPERLRVNLGAQFTQSPFRRSVVTVETVGLNTYTRQQASGTTDPLSTNLTTTDYSVNEDVRTDPDFEAGLSSVASNPIVDYDGGITFFFDENMYLDLNLDLSGNVWDSASWSLDMTIQQ